MGKEGFRCEVCPDGREGLGSTTSKVCINSINQNDHCAKLTKQSCVCYYSAHKLDLGPLQSMRHETPFYKSGSELDQRRHAAATAAI